MIQVPWLFLTNKIALFQQWASMFCNICLRLWLLVLVMPSPMVYKEKLECHPFIANILSVSLGTQNNQQVIMVIQVQSWFFW